MKNKKQLLKMWAKIELNSCYGFSHRNKNTFFYNEETKQIILKESQENLLKIIQILKNDRRK